MIYFVSKQLSLFDDEVKVVSVEQSFELIRPLKRYGLDTETMGFSPYLKRLLMVQIGCPDYQVVIDTGTIDITLYKWFFEDKERLAVITNAKFDLKFFYHHRIVISNLFDTFLAEKILFLGYPPGIHSCSLQATLQKYLGVYLDKSIRGEIIYKGLTLDVIKYGAKDTQYLLPLMDAQMEALREKDLVDSCKLECLFVKVLAYIEYCGVKLDAEKWKAKMQSDLQRQNEALDKLNAWVVEWALNTSEEEKLSKRISQYVDLHPQLDLFAETTGPKCKINWNSSKQVIPFLEELGFKLETFDKETKEKKKSIEATIIEPQKDVSPIAPLYLEYRGAQKEVSTYGQNWLNNINPISGRIHTNFTQLMDTGRLSCGGGEDKELGQFYHTKVKVVNLQNLPAKKETRACFVAEPGNKWISRDYSGQESRLIASIANDEAMIDLFNNGCGDVHSLTAKMAYPDIIGDCPVEEIKSKFKHYRQEAKGIEFAINYGGDANTIMNNKGIPLKEAQEIYDNYMKGFKGIAAYQEYCRRRVMEVGYILLNPIIRNKAYIYDYDKLMRAKERFDDEFWAEYRAYKNSKERTFELTKAEKGYIWDEFTSDDTTIEEIADGYHVNNYTIMKTVVTHYFRRVSDSGKQSINYRIQATGALCFKLASIKFFNWLVENNLLFKVKYCIPVHDEINIECPEELVDKVDKALAYCMESAGELFCKKVKMPSDAEISDYWVH